VWGRGFSTTAGLTGIAKSKNFNHEAHEKRGGKRKFSEIFFRVPVAKAFSVQPNTP
jgi:hypothetical protein